LVRTWLCFFLLLFFILYYFIFILSFYCFLLPMVNKVVYIGLTKNS